MANINPGLDGSGNGNNWAPVNINFYTSSSTTYDVMTDVPTNTSATTANYCVLNPLDKNTSNITISNGNLTLSTSSTNYGTRSTYFISSGKWYWEATVGAIGTSAVTIGIANSSWDLGYVGDTNTYGYLSSNGNKGTGGTFTSYGATFTTNDVIGVAFDADNGTLTFYKNNTSQGTAFTGISGSWSPAFAGQTNSVLNVNFGQRPFAYTPPANYVALNTYNLPTPTIGATASSQANKYFDATTYTGSGSTQSIVNSGAMQPDMVWLKIRSSADSHNISDSVRGISGTGSPVLFTNGTGAEATFTGYGVSALNSNGFTLIGNGGLSNASGSTYVAWQWRAGNSSGVTNTAGSITSTVSANTTSGFSIVTYTGTGSAATVGHGLGVAPKMVIVKERSTTRDWPVWQTSLTGGQALFLNSTLNTQSDTTIWNNTTPTSSVFSVATSTYTNQSSGTYVAYCFSEVPGYSKFGSYTGNSSTDGAFIYTGFRPKFVLFKCSTNSGTYWILIDAARNTYNLANTQLFPNAADADTTGGSADQPIDILSNGFKLRGTGGAGNESGRTYIYAAFAESPFKYANAR